MPTQSEKRALVVLAALGALGVGIRAFRPAPPISTAGRDAHGSQAALARQIEAVDSATSAKRGGSGRGRSRRVARGVDTLVAAPKPAPRKERPTARTVPEPPAPVRDPLELYEARRAEVTRKNRDAQARIDRDLASTLRSPAAPPTPADRANGGAVSRTPVDLDTADAATIASLPWIGSALAARIVADRDARGPFGSLAGLQRVRGVGPSLSTKIGQFVTFSRSGTGAERVVKFRTLRVRPKRP